MSAAGERAALEALDARDVPAYLDANSRLPGPRANLELVAAVVEVAPRPLALALADDPDEFRRLCGTAALGRLLAAGDDVLELLETRAGDASWRVREGVAMALQRLGDEHPERLRPLVAEWAGRPEPLVARAAVAGLCEPRLLRDPASARAALDACEAATSTVRAMPDERRRAEDARALRKALGYCWSVAIAAAPAEGLPRFAVLAADPDPDVRWIVRENRGKARLRRLLPD